MCVSIDTHQSNLFPRLLGTQGPNNYIHIHTSIRVCVCVSLDADQRNSFQRLLGTQGPNKLT